MVVRADATPVERVHTRAELRDRDIKLIRRRLCRCFDALRLFVAAPLQRQPGDADRLGKTQRDLRWSVRENAVIGRHGAREVRIRLRKARHREHCGAQQDSEAHRIIH